MVAGVTKTFLIVFVDQLCKVTVQIKVCKIQTSFNIFMKIISFFNLCLKIDTFFIKTAVLSTELGFVRNIT